LHCDTTKYPKLMLFFSNDSVASTNLLNDTVSVHITRILIY